MKKSSLTVALTLLASLVIGQGKVDSRNGYFSISQIDSICSSVDLNENLFTMLGCGDRITTRVSYKDQNQDTLVKRFQTVYMDSPGEDYGQVFYYQDMKPVKAVMSIYNLNIEKIYEATYYFANDQFIKVTGETNQNFSAAEIINYAVKGCYCLPKN